MTSDRYLLLSFGHARAEWFRSVARWATDGAAPIDNVKCVSPEEVRAHLTSGRMFSAALLEGAAMGVDRDLLAAVADAGCLPVVLADPRRPRPWAELGAGVVLGPDLTREQLLEVLRTHARPVGDAVVTYSPDVTAGTGTVVAVCGPGGTGTSTVAIALAQGLAAADGDVLLADLRLRGEQGMLHGARELFPGLQELVESYRGGALAAGEIRRLTVPVPERGYQLLLGLRRPRYWSALRPRAFEAAFAALCGTFAWVVCDIDADFEGEADAGSADVEERNVAARTALRAADVVLAVCRPGMKGLHSLVRLITEIVDAGVDARRILPVVNRAPRQPWARASLARSLGVLVGPTVAGVLPAPVFLPTRQVDLALRDGVALPSPLAAVSAGAVERLLDGAGHKEVADMAPTPVTPGSLGSWTVQEAG